MVDIYSKGIFCISVCAPIDMDRKELTRLVNEQYECGTDKGWTISDDKYFADGTTENGGVVDCHKGKTRHWLFDA